MDEMITITKREYDELIKRDAWLYYLESAGVDNWEGISYAYELRREDKGSEDD
jgi:hypothetical protein